jgi:hypothetical protein
VAAQSKAWTVFAGIMVSNPTWGKGVCVFILFVLSCVYVAALRRTDPPSKESYVLCKKDEETEGAAKVLQSAVDP